MHICDVLDFDFYCLVDYQMELVTWAATPKEVLLKEIENGLDFCG
jgi:hypothetical protein